jgi:hypothetical protein
MNFAECETFIEHPIIVLKENNRRLRINNPGRQQIRRVHVDGCVITDGVRCDYLIIGQDNSEYFVELKGSDIEHAVKQLETTINRIGAKVKGIQRYSIVVSSRCPLFTPRVQQIRVHFKKNLNSEFMIKCISCEIDL